jgi:hypothetical protein
MQLIFRYPVRVNDCFILYKTRNDCFILYNTKD